MVASPLLALLLMLGGDAASAPHPILRDSLITCRRTGERGAIFNGYLRYEIENFKSTGGSSFIVEGHILKINSGNLVHRSSDCTKNRYVVRLERNVTQLRCDTGEIVTPPGLWSLGETNGCEVE